MGLAPTGRVHPLERKAIAMSSETRYLVELEEDGNLTGLFWSREHGEFGIVERATKFRSQAEAEAAVSDYRWPGPEPPEYEITEHQFEVV
jgi:hypothetical protein